MSVAVITSCYNEAAYIRDTIESVRRQTAPAREHIVVDDGSTDTSPEILAEYPHLRVLRVTNRGQPNAQNAGIMSLSADVEWVVFVDGDDWLEPNFIEACLATAAGDPEAGVVFSRCVRHHPDGTETEPTFPAVLHPTEEQLWSWCYAHSCAMIRRDILVEAGGFHGMMRGDHDWDFWIDCVKRGVLFAYASDTWYHYRLNPAGYTMTVATKLQPGHIAEMRRHHGVKEEA